MRKLIDSNIEWIRLIPQHWNIKPISSCFKERNEKVSDYDWEPLSVTKQGIVRQLDTAAKSDAHDSRKKVCKNDFVINSRSDRKQSCGVSPFNGSVSLINIVLEPRSICPRFAKYLLKNYGFAEEFYRYGSGIVADLWSTNYQKMKKIMIPVPDKEEQLKIADFLDEKIQEIDNAIEKTKETIEDYKKLKQTIITKVVTKGLDENAVFKDSNTDWIGKINSKYEIARLKNVAKINGRIGFRGYTQSDIVSEGEGAITISPSNFSNMKMNYSKCQYISWDKYYESPEIQLKNGDILFVKTGSTYGKTCLVQDLPLEATINPQSIIIKPQSINDRYLTYYLNSNLTTYQVEISVVGGTIPTISQEKINNYLIILPPSEEQIAIVEYLDKKCREFDNLIESKERIVEELEQYKKSVIYEYVTGKKEVK